MLQRLTLGAALAVAASLAACSDGDGSRITAKTAQTAVDANRVGGPHSNIDHDSQLNWGPAPPIFPAGAQFTVVQGDPSVPGAIFTVRLRFPSGYVLPPHWHPTDEHVTVLHGTFLVAMGENFSRSGLTELRQDAFITAPAHMAHFAMTRGETEVQVHAIGPFQLTYVHPADDPTK